MKKKLLAATLSLALTLGLLAGCAGGGAADVPTPDQAADVKTGLSMVTTVDESKPATAEAPGSARANIALVAVTVTDEGVIDSCVIDTVQSKIEFDASGKLTTDKTTLFPSKNVLGTDYGMSKASSIGKEWNEQAAAFAAYAAGKTVADLKGIAVNEKGAATDKDLAASITLALGNFLPGIEDAVNNAQHLGAKAGDKLALTASTNMAKSKDAAADAEGLAQAYATVAAVTLKDETVTSCYLNAVQANVKFDATGAITGDLTAPVPSKNELGDDYGMKKASGIGKEWNEQAAAFAAYATGKTVAEITGLAVDDHGSATSADVTASVTIGISDFQALIAAAK